MTNTSTRKTQPARPAPRTAAARSRPDAERPDAERPDAARAYAAVAPAAGSDGFDFDLDALTLEAGAGRFTFKAGGKLWEMFGPEEISWLDNSSIAERMTYVEDQRPMLKMLLGEEQYERFLDLPPISPKHLEGLFGAWQKHHGITVPESDASRRS